MRLVIMVLVEGAPLSKKDIRYFSLIVFVVSLVSAAIINTPVGMKQIGDLLAFFGLGYLIIGIVLS